MGSQNPRLDEKGRLILPARYRDELAGGVVITKGQDHCLFLYSKARFDEVTAKVAEVPMTSGKAREFIRVFLAGAYDEIPDKQGRVTIPAPLRAYAGLERDCTVNGMYDRLEIWQTERWETYLSQAEPTFASVTEEVMPGTF